MLLINLSYNINELKLFLHHHPEWKIANLLDFSGVAEMEKHKSLYFPSDLDPGNILHEKALTKYIQESGRLSTIKVNEEDLRSFAFKGLPLFWLTSISEKHPQNSVLKNLYYFEQIWEAIKANYTKVAFVLPVYGLHFQSAIKSFVCKQRQVEVCFNLPSKEAESIRCFFSYLKGYESNIQELKQRIRSLKEGGAGESSSLIFTYIPETWIESKEEDAVLGDVEKLIVAEKGSAAYVPYFMEPSTIKEFKGHPKFARELFRSFPTQLQRVNLYLSLLNLYKKVNKTSFKDTGIEFVDSDVLKHEFNQLLFYRINHLLNYIWLINFFKSTNNGLTVYYQDEFYVSGRVISAAVNFVDKNIRSVGVQHGIFYTAHTVYAITDDELKATREGNGLPIPSEFIVWGNYFKEQFLKFNSLPKTYAVNAGHLKYINKKSGLKADATPLDNKSIVILWCTTLKSDTIRQFRLIKEVLLTDSRAIIKVRCHPSEPLKEFITKDLLDGKFAEKFTFSNEEAILTDLQKSDVVFCSSGSSVFLDAMVMNTPIFHFINDDYYMGDLGRKEMVEIRTQGDLKQAFERLLEKESKKHDYSNILHMDGLIWKSIVNKKNDRRKVEA